MEKQINTNLIHIILDIKKLLLIRLFKLLYIYNKLFLVFNEVVNKFYFYLFFINLFFLIYNLFIPNKLV